MDFVAEGFTSSGRFVFFGTDGRLLVLRRASLNLVIAHRSLGPSLFLPRDPPQRGWKDFMNENGPHGAGGYVRARERVDAAAGESSRLRDEHEQAKGTPGELDAHASLEAANQEVAARKRWLQWVEERDY